MRIVKDTRERKGYDFAFYDVELIHKALPCGDYMLENNTDIVIERKACIDEVYTNLSTKKEFVRFTKECAKLKAFKYPILLLEFPEEHVYTFPRSSEMSKTTIASLKMPTHMFQDRFYNLAVDFYPLRFVFTNTKADAEAKVYELFESVQNGRPIFNGF